MNLRAGTVALLLSAAAAGAEKPVAPLENSKQELKNLQRDQATKSNGNATGRLTEGLPQYQGPAPGVTPLELPAPGKSQADLQKKKDAKKNWLADGVNQLEKSARKTGVGTDEPREGGDAAEEIGPPDPSDPDYMLKVYGERQKEDEARNKAKHASAVPNDAFAPFLQDWLGTSPAQGRFFDEFTRRPQSGGVGTALAGVPPASVGQGIGAADPAMASREPVATVKSNPYLQGLDMSSLHDANLGRTQASDRQGPIQKSGEILPVPRSADPMPILQPLDKKPLLPALSDDKKYFPQQKKF